MGKDTPPLSIKVSSFYCYIGLVVSIGLGCILLNVYTEILPNRLLAVVGILLIGVSTVFGIWVYVTNFITKVGPYTAYIDSEVDDLRCATAEDIIFDNRGDAMYFCAYLSGQRVTYRYIDSTQLQIKTANETIDYTVNYQGGLSELLDIRQTVISRDIRTARGVTSPGGSPVLWFQSWVRFKHRELQRYITSLENRTGTPHDRAEVLKKLHLTFEHNYAQFGVTVSVNET